MLVIARDMMIRTLRYGAISLLLLLTAFSGVRPAAAGLAVETNDVLTFEYQQVGANEEEAVRLACIRGVQATLGRLLFSDYSVQARDLLEPYLQKNWQKFVASSYVLERRAERDGFGVRIRVQTYPELLQRDLRQKKFLYLPRPNPYHYVFLAETLDGRFSTGEVGRRTVIDTLVQQGMKVYESGVQVPPNNTDVMTDPERFAAAREAATRIGAETIVSGRAETRKVGEAEVFFEKLQTYETRVHLDLIRTDDGTLIGSAENVERASDKDPNAARDESIRSAVQTATQRLLDTTRGIWRNTVLEQAEFSLMFTDLSPVEVQDVMHHLEAMLGHGTRTHLRSYYGGVAVVNVNTERNYAALERVIHDFRSFDMRITDRKGKRITIDVHH